MELEVYGYVNIVIAKAPIDTDYSKIEEAMFDDEVLSESIKRIANSFSDIEVFNQNQNVIATEVGYFIALYEHQLKLK